MQLPPLAVGPIALLAALKLALHLAVNATTPYGFHRDELLYLAMGRHLQLWRMDFPPGIALLAEATRALLGDSLFAIRLPAALAGTAVLVIAALLARELGGGRPAQVLAALAVLSSPLFLRSANLFQPVVLDQLTWTAALFALARLCRTAEPRWWAALGAVLGLGLLVKFSIAFIGLGIGTGILLTRLRSELRRPWPWLALGLALAIGSPSLVGQLRLGFPVLGQMADLQTTQLQRVTPAEFLLGQLLWGPGTVLAWAGGVALLAAERFRAFRAVGWSCAAAFVLLLGLSGKPYYIGPAYPVLLGAGAGLLESLGSSAAGHLLRWGTAALLLLYGLVTLPFGVPVLPPPMMAGYARAVGLTAALRTNTGELGRLPQDYADMLGWEEQVAAVARVYHDLPPRDRGRAVLVAANYGEAGALDHFGPRHGLPRAVSPVGSYWFFGPGEKPGDVVVTIGVPRDQLVPLFDSLQPAARLGHPWAVDEERDVPVFVARGPQRTLQELWPTLAGLH